MIVKDLYVTTLASPSQTWFDTATIDGEWRAGDSFEPLIIHWLSSDGTKRTSVFMARTLVSVTFDALPKE